MEITNLAKTQETLHKHAFWLYGIIAGLAIKEALSVVVPHVLSFLSPEANVDPNYNRTLVVAELIRLVVFLVVIVRFYVGSAFFFESAHLNTSGEKPIEPQDYAKDFLSGLLHFLLFFIWSFSIDTLTRALWLFPAILALILSYDFLWLVFCKHIRNHPLLIFWTVINLFTLIAGALIYLGIWIIWPTHQLLAEELTLCLVIAASLEDLRVMLIRTNSFLSQQVDRLYNAKKKLEQE
jgi:hypothetical protein